MLKAVKLKGLLNHAHLSRTISRWKVPLEVHKERSNYRCKILKTKYRHIYSFSLTQTLIGNCQTSFWGAPKSLQMVIVAMKLKDAYSLEGKL